MNYTTIFTDLDDFRSYADGLQADTAYRQLHPSIRSTAMEMEKVITRAAFEAIASGSWAPAATEQHPNPAAISLTDGKELLKIALAAGTLYRYQIFTTIKRAGSEAALYKYQHEELKDTYIENYWKAMDDLLDYLDEHPAVAGWGESTASKDRQLLPVRSAEEFHRYFGINRSAFFYSKALYLIRDVWAKLSPAVAGHTDNEKVMEAARKALCYRVIAKVVATWDLSEFPRCLRFDYNHEYTKGSSTASREQLHLSLLAEAQAAEKEMESIKRHSAEGDATGNSNVESDKFYFSI